MIKINFIRRLINLLKRKKVQPVEITKEIVAELECAVDLENGTVTLEDIHYVHKKSEFEKKVDKLKAILIKTKKYRIRKKIRKRIIKLED